MWARANPHNVLLECGLDLLQMASAATAAQRRLSAQTWLARLFLRREHMGAAMLMMLVALVYLWPALIAGKVLSPNSVLFLFAPWQSTAPAGFEHTWNPVLSDIPTAYYPWNFFARQMIHAGIFPAWNPNAYSGTPFYANAQTAILSPFNIPLWLLPLNYGIAFSSWLKLWLGGFGTYLLVRELKLGFWPGVLAGVSFLLCAFNVVWITFETLPAVAVMMPWALWSGERIVCRRRQGDVIALAVVTALVIAAGHPETAVQTLVGTFCYMAIRALTIPGVPRRKRVKGLTLGVAGLAAGTLLSAVTLIPVLKAGLGTPGAASRIGGQSTLPWSALKTALFPAWWEIRTLPLPGPANYNERTFYVGAAALLLACTAMISRERWREKLPLVLLATIGVAAAFGLPVIHWVTAHVPPLNRATTARMLLWFELAVPVLAAFGLQALIDAPRRQRTAWMILAAAAAVALLATVAVDPSMHEIRTTLNHLRTGRSYEDPKIISMTSIGWWLIFTALVGVVLVLFRSSGYTRLAAVAIVLVATVDLLHFAHGYQPMLAAAEATPASTPAVEYLQRHAGAGRIVGIGNTLTNDYDMVYGLHDARGYDPPQPSYRYFRLWQLANPSQIATQPFQLLAVSPVGLTVMSMLGVRYVIAAPGEPPLRELERSVVYRGPDATIYETRAGAPQALVARRVSVTSDEHATLAAISSGDFNPNAEAIVEDNQPGVEGLPTGSTGGTANVVDAGNATVALRVRLARPGLVVLNEAMAAGWSVTVDGHPRAGLRVDDVMRGVSVPAGVHAVVWRYRVPGLRLGLALSGLVALSLLLLGVGARLRRGRSARA